MLIRTFKYNEFDFKMTLRFLYEQSKDSKLVKKYLPCLLKYKIVEDSEYKINARNRISSKLLNTYGFVNGHDSAGLVMSWASLEPKMDKLYESFLSDSIKFYKSINSIGQLASSSIHIEELSCKKLHLFVVTRLDLSNNCLEAVPFCLFQMESLRSLKLSNNSIKKLPLSKSTEFDDLGSKSERFR